MTPFRRHLLLLPNLISLGRIFFIVVAAVFFFAGFRVLGLGIGIVAGLSDYLDGYLARKRGEVTQVGALLDSLADILFTLVCFTIAVHIGIWPPYILVAWGFRDMSVMVLRGSAGQQGFTIPSSFLAKLAWNFNAYASVMMGLDVIQPFGPGTVATVIHWLGLLGVHAGIAMQWISGYQYAASYAKQYRG